MDGFLAGGAAGAEAISGNIGQASSQFVKQATSIENAIDVLRRYNDSLNITRTIKAMRIWLKSKPNANIITLSVLVNKPIRHSIPKPSALALM